MPLTSGGLSNRERFRAFTGAARRADLIDKVSNRPHSLILFFPNQRLREMLGGD
jgi:hypothetical protein